MHHSGHWTNSKEDGAIHQTEGGQKAKRCHHKPISSVCSFRVEKSPGRANLQHCRTLPRVETITETTGSYACQHVAHAAWHTAN